MNVDTKTKLLIKFGGLRTVCVDGRSNKLLKLSHCQYVWCLGLCTHSHTVLSPPNFISNFVLVSTFIIWSFITWRQSVVSWHVWECVHNPKHHTYWQCDNFSSLLDLPSTHTVLSPPNFISNFVLVSTFIIWSFITWRQSVVSWHVWECVHNPKHHTYRQCDNFSSLLDLPSTHTVPSPPNFISNFVLVSTFIIWSFITWRQSVVSWHVWECVHNPKHHVYWQCDNFKSLLDLPSTHTVLSPPNFISNIVLVSTFIILSFITWRQSVVSWHVWECVHNPKHHTYRQCDNFKSLLDLPSTHTVLSPPNFISNIVLVSTFIIWSFITWRQSVVSWHVWECVHNPKHHTYWQCDNFSSLLDLPSTHTVLSPPNFISNFVLVSTFIIWSFITWRQSVVSWHVWECVHNPSITRIDNVTISVAYWTSHPHTLSLVHQTLSVTLF